MRACGGICPRRWRRRPLVHALPVTGETTAAVAGRPSSAPDAPPVLSRCAGLSMGGIVREWEMPGTRPPDGSRRVAMLGTNPLVPKSPEVSWARAAQGQIDRAPVSGGLDGVMSRVWSQTIWAVRPNVPRPSELWPRLARALRAPRIGSAPSSLALQRPARPHAYAWALHRARAGADWGRKEPPLPPGPADLMQALMR